jgi:purine-binding chemotaxis protein CheW
MRGPEINKDKSVQNEQRVLAVYLGNSLFGIPISQIQGVLETLPLTYVPLAPPAVRGVMNLRGRIVTAIDLRVCLCLLDDQNISPVQANMSVVIEDSGELYSLLVDGVGDVHAIPAEDIEELPLTMNVSLIRVSYGVFQLRDKVMIILNPSALLNFMGE